MINADRYLNENVYIEYLKIRLKNKIITAIKLYLRYENFIQISIIKGF